LAREFSLNCVTLDGDQVNKRGALTGGFLDSRYSRVKLQKTITKTQKQLSELTIESNKIKKTSQEIDQAINSVLGELQKMESTKTGNLDTFEQMKLDLRAKSNELQICIEILEQKQRQLSTESSNSLQLQQTVTSYENEKGTELFSQLSNDDKQQLLLVNEEISKLKEILIVAARSQVELESSKKIYQIN